MSRRKETCRKIAKRNILFILFLFLAFASIGTFTEIPTIIFVIDLLRP